MMTKKTMLAIIGHGAPAGLRCCAWLGCMLLIAACAWAASPTPASSTNDSLPIPKAPRVTSAPVQPVNITAGTPGKVELAFRVEQGYHINSNQPHNDLLMPTTLRFDPPTDVMVGKLSYPAGQDLTFEFLPGETMNVYTGDFVVHALVSTSKSIARGTYRVRGALKYQACDNRQCYPPKEVPIQFDVNVKKAASHVRHNPGQSPHVHQ